MKIDSRIYGCLAFFQGDVLARTDRGLARQPTRCREFLPCRRRSRGGFSLIEAMVVLTITGILVAMCIPSYRRAVEQTKADIAVANLRAVWSAQRLYWLEYQTYASEMKELQSLGLLDPDVVLSATGYEYVITSDGTNSFLAVAIRCDGGGWSGQLEIDETGLISGAISSPGQSDITPGYQ